MPITSGDVMWVTGLVDGEGSPRWHERRSNPDIKVAMSDRDVIEHLAALWGTAVWERRRQKGIPAHYKVMYSTTLVGARAIGWMYMMLAVTRLSARRRAKMRDIIAKWRLCRRANRFKTVCPQGHPLPP